MNKKRLYLTLALSLLIFIIIFVIYSYRGDNAAGQEKEQIYGRLVDEAGRCEHYHSPLDIIANRCATCGKLYSCYRCHNELEDHDFAPVDEDEPATVMCGVCGAKFSYKTYSSLTNCTTCGAQFNPRCSLHKDIYVK